MKNCPFCGSSSIKPMSVKKPNTSSEHFYYLRCNNCFSRGPVQESLVKAKLAWSGELEEIRDESQTTLIDQIGEK